jgi:hypothetical protein
MLTGQLHDKCFVANVLEVMILKLNREGGKFDLGLT